MKITFSKSEPWQAGWKGWADHVDVFVDGREAGSLSAEGCSQKRWLDYYYKGHHPILKKRYPMFGVTGIRAARQAVREALVFGGAS